LKKSQAHFIRARATPARREAFIRNYHKQVSRSKIEGRINGLLSGGFIKTRDEYTRPTVVILQKPRSGMPEMRERRSRIQLISLADIDSQELRLVERALQDLMSLFGER